MTTTNTSLITAENFLWFCGLKPADQEYDYLSNYDCPWGQFLQSLGATNYGVGGFDYTLEGKHRTFPFHEDVLAGYANEADPAYYPEARTWGELAKRVRAAIGEPVHAAAATP